LILTFWLLFNCLVVEFAEVDEAKTYLMYLIDFIKLQHNEFLMINCFVAFSVRIFSWQMSGLF